MKPDDFEQQLRNLPLRPVPPDWRAEMLIVARVAGKEARSMEREREVSVPWWRAWLWPCPQAWAGLAAVWVLLIGLHWGTPSPSAVAHKSGAGVTEELAGLAAQRRELTRLLDVPLDLAPAPESTVKPTPRSMAEPRSNPRAEVFSGRVLVAAGFHLRPMRGVGGRHLSLLPKSAGSETGVPVFQV